MDRLKPHTAAACVISMLSGVRRRPMTTHAKIAPASATAASASIDTVMAPEVAVSTAYSAELTRLR